MKVYTRKGDAGETALIGGKRVSKDSLRIESYGTVDELNSFVGLLRDYSESVGSQVAEALIEIQDRLFTLGSLLAEAPEGSKMQLPQLQDADVEFLEQEIDKMDQVLPPMRSFVLPGGHPAVSTAHICRTVCRRAERLVVSLSRTDAIDALLPKYLNRLSDYFFVLSRKLAFDLKIEETPWKPRM